VIFARLESGETPGEYISIFFWGSIKKLSYETYRDKFDKYEYGNIFDDVTRQIKVLSDITHHKYQLINRGVIFLVIMLSQVLILLILKVFAWS
jgi:hypothetical protein